jgi:ankyrin repeat protein
MRKTTRTRNSYLDIHEAARKGKDDVLTTLLNSGTDINSRQSEGLTPLMVAACFSDKRSTLELLLERGADVNLYDHGKRTALMHCINCNRKEETKILIKKGANINAQDKYGMSALMKACYLGNVEIVRFLLKHGAVTKFREKRSGNTAILIALANRCLKKSFEIVRLLADHGADMNAKNKEGTSGLYYSALMGHTAALSFFLQHGKKSHVNQLR